MSRTKNIIKKIIGYKNLNRINFMRRTYKKSKKMDKKMPIFNIILKTKIKNSYTALCKTIELDKEYSNFYYSIDIYKTLYYEGSVISNLMLDYKRILDNSLEDFKKLLDKNTKFDRDELECIKGIEVLIEREVNIITNNEIRERLRGITNRKANSFKDAIQRILFFNQLMWQTGHNLNGLGRLDLILNEYYTNDVNNKVITKDEAKNLLREFLEILHKDYYFKSNTLSGDIGQIIILGGYDKDGKNICNELTYIFIELMKELKIPDPKVLLRVNKETTRDIIELSTRCIQTGIGCPLFANDDVIIPKLIEFGYDNNDVFNYGTAACWEPFITGKSFDQNNLKSISFMQPFNTMISEEEFERKDNIKDIIELYKQYLNKYLEEFIMQINEIKFGHDPLLSLLTDKCIENRKDISCGGAKYNEYGFTGVGLSNVVNSIQSLNKFVFSERRYNLREFNEIRRRNFENYDNLLKETKDFKERYGTDNAACVDLTNEIIRYTTNVFSKYTNPLGGRYKFGLSAPSYIDESINFPASFDGRKKGEPFGVHISCDVSNGYTELIQFTSKIDYGENRFNGNVADFIVSPNFIEDNFEKFVDFLVLSIKVGFFEMQMNVVNSKTLIEAKENPEKFPNLIVRVWGFSAYFKDLPEEYKNYIIERALKSEGNS